MTAVIPRAWWAEGHPIGVVLHHSGVEGDTILSTINYHTDSVANGGRGWASTYHYIVDREGACHASGDDHNGYNGMDYANRNYLSVCALGNFNARMSMPEAQRAMLLAVCRELKQKYPHILPAHVFRHEAVNPRKLGECPGRYYPDADFREVFA